MNTIVDYNRKIRGFNAFIGKTELEDILLVGRKFTWYKPNGSIKSRIDRVLVSRKWLEKWSDRKQFVLSRSVSDHCTLVLKDTSVDWAPKLFRCLDIWQRDGRFKDFIRNKWNNYEVQCSRVFIFKENLKKLKSGTNKSLEMLIS